VTACQAAPVLADGSYEAMVIEAEDGGDDQFHLSITILAGEAKGEVVEVRAARLQYDAIDLLAMPCILTVHGGEPSVIFD
jgi:hypothetical protein